MNKIIISFILFLSYPAFGQSFSLSRKVFNNSDISFISHSGTQKFQSYLSMEVNFPPVAELFKELLIAKRVQMTSRGEAHITVITPVEFDNVLSAKMTMKEIDVIARRANIQNAEFKVICLGKGAAMIEGKSEDTYYVVVQSDELLSIREKIQKKFEEKGGAKGKFLATQFYPHITLGFTKRDLHETDGIIKDERSCHADIRMK